MTEEIPPIMSVGMSDGTIPTVPQTFQSPAVRVIAVMFSMVHVVKTTDSENVTNSPTLRVATLLFVVVPTMPEDAIVPVTTILPAPVTRINSFDVVAPEPT